MKPKIYVTRKLPDTIISMYKNDFEIEMWNEEDIPVPREVLLEKVKGKDGIFCLLTDKIDEKVMKNGEDLKVIANMAVGYDNIDIKYAVEHNINVTNTPGVLTETTADLTFALLMAAGRRIVESDQYLKGDLWKTWSPFQLAGQDIHGSTLGIIGMGRIAEALVKRATGFNMDIQYYNRSRKYEVEKEYNIKYKSLDDLLATSDFICILIPYSEEVRHLISYKELSLMKSNAIIINTARGGIIDELALYDFLKNKKIMGAGLDVFEEEPVSMNNPLLKLPNVTTLPHIGSSSEKTREKMIDLAFSNLKAVLNGEVALTPVNE